MANRLVDNFIIADSSMGNLPIVGGTSSNLTIFYVNAFAFLATDTSSVCVIAGNDTSNHIFRARFVAADSATTGSVPALQTLVFANPQKFNALKIPTLTAGTAWVFLA